MEEKCNEINFASIEGINKKESLRKTKGVIRETKGESSSTIRNQ